MTTMAIRQRSGIVEVSMGQTRVTRRRFLIGTLTTVGLVQVLSACAPASAPAAKPTEAAKPAAPAAAATPASAPPTSAPAAAAKPTEASKPADAAKPAEAAKPTEAAKPAEKPVAATTTAPAPGKPVRGGSLKTTIGADPGTMDAHVGATIFAYSILDSINPGLVVEDDKTAELKPGLAERWEATDDKTYTFYLRKGVKFHDGSPLTAEDIKFTVERLQDKDAKVGTGPGYKQRVEPVEAIEIVNDTTVRFKLKAPLAVFPGGLVEVRVVPRSYDVQKPVGAGPFAFVEWSKNQHVKLKRFDGFWDAERPYVDELIYYPTPDEDGKITRLQTDQVNFSDTIPFPRIEEVKKLPNVQIYQKDAAYTPSHYPLIINSKRPPFEKVEVRQALSWAIDRQAIKDATFGYGAIISSAVPRANWAFNPKAPSYDKQDLEMAKDLLRKAGLPGGFKAQFKFVTSRAEYTPIAQLLQDSWSKVGIQVDLLPRDLNVFVEEVNNRADFEIGMTGYLPGWDPHWLFTQTYVANRNQTGWSNEEFDRLYKEAGAIADQAKRQPMYQRMHEIVQIEQPLVTIGHRFIIMAASKQVQGFEPNYRQFNHFDYTWLQK
jgi:peptide/nickel transport system substrate-binding protein